jgi:hypothetical protein
MASSMHLSTLRADLLFPLSNIWGVCDFWRWRTDLLMEICSLFVCNLNLHFALSSKPKLFGCFVSSFAMCVLKYSGQFTGQYIFKVTKTQGKYPSIKILEETEQKQESPAGLRLASERSSLAPSARSQAEQKQEQKQEFCLLLQ